MSRTFVFAIAGSLLFASAVSADVPPPPNAKTMARVSFQGIEEHPDYVFYLLRPGGGGGPRTFPPTLTAVKDSKPFNLNGGRYGLGGMKLLAVEQKEFDKRAKDDPALKWLTGKIEGFLSAALDAPVMVAPADVKEDPTTTYNVSLKEGKLTVELVPDAKRSESTPTGLVPTAVAGLGIAICMAGMGLWLTRRSRNVHEETPLRDKETG